MASQQSTFSLTLFMDIYLSWQLQELLFAGMFWRKGILPKVSLGLTLLQVIYWIMAVVAYGVVVWEGITIKEYQEIIILNVVITSIAWTWGLILWIHLFTKPDRYLTREKTPFTPKSENRLTELTGDEPEEEFEAILDALEDKESSSSEDETKNSL